MNWHDGLALTWHWCGYVFNPWRTQIKLYFFFAILGFGLNLKG